MAAFHVGSLCATEKLNNFTLFDNIGANPDTVRIITFSDTGDSIPLDGNTTIMEIAVTVDSLAAPGAYPLTFVNAVEAITPDPTVGSIDMMVQNGVIYVDALGDVNLDQATDVADMVNLTGYILNRVTLDERQLDVADVNVDGLANVVDLVAIINSVLGFSPLTAPAVPLFTGGEAELQLVFGSQSGDEAVYYLDGILPTDVAGMELSIQYDASRLEPYVPSRVAEGSGLSVQSVREDGHMKIVAYYNADPDNVVPSGPGRYLQLPIRLKDGWSAGAQVPLVLEAAVLSDPEAAKIPVKSTGGGGVLPTTFVLRQNYPNPFNPSTTIEFLLDGGSQERVILDRLSFRPGDIVDIRQVRASERRLKASQLFIVNPTEGNPPRIVIKPPDLTETENLARRQGGRSVRGQSPDAGESPSGEREIDLDVYVTPTLP